VLVTREIAKAVCAASSPHGNGGMDARMPVGDIRRSLARLYDMHWQRFPAGVVMCVTNYHRVRESAAALRVRVCVRPSVPPEVFAPVADLSHR
jgi:hypothetical protein